MLDWFSRERLSDERQEDGPPPPTIFDFLPDYALQKRDGSLLFLSTVEGPLALMVLPHPLSPAETYLVASFPEKFREVRPEITRVVVVTRPEYLSTVVALGGDMLFLSDNFGNLVLQLAPDAATVYLLSPDRRILDIIALAADHLGDDPFVTSSLRPAA